MMKNMNGIKIYIYNYSLKQYKDKALLQSIRNVK